MQEKDYFVFEIETEHLQGLLSYKSQQSPEQPNWKSLGDFYGTIDQAEKELERRLKAYKKAN